MPASRSTTLLWILLLALGLAVGGCDDSGGGSSSGATAGSTGSSGSSASSGSSGSGTRAPDQDPPLLTVTGPAPASYHPPGTVQVTGNATDSGSGLANVLVDGTPARVTPSGDFDVSHPLDAGLNIIVVRAADTQGNVAERSIGVMAGDYLPAGRTVSDAAVARLSESTLQTVADGIAQNVLTPQRLQQSLAAQNPVFQRRVTVFGATVASAEVDVTGVRFGTPSLTLDAVSGGLDGAVTIPNLEVDVDARDIGGIGWSSSGTVSADPAEVTARTQVGVTNGQVNATVTGATADLRNFAVNLSGLPSVLVPLFHNQIEDALEDTVEQEIRSRFPSLLARAIQDLASPQTTQVLNVPFTVAAVPERLAFDADGVEMGIGLDASAPPASSAPQVPGSLHTPNPAGPLSRQRGLDLAIADDTLNRILHVLWQAGAFDLAIDDQFFRNQGLQVPFQFNSAFLVSFVPSLATTFPGNQSVPLRMVFEPQMAPVVRVTGQPDLLQLQMGELELTLQADTGSGFTTLVEFVLQVEASASLDLQNGALQPSVQQMPTFRVDVVSAPPNMDTQSIVQFLQYAVPPTIQAATSLVPPIRIPALPSGSRLVQPVLQQGYGDHVELLGDIR